MSAEPYTQIAPYYDLLMEEVNYGGWVDHICQLLQRHRIAAGTVLDLACGTGTCAMLWAERGYKVQGLDRAEPMLAEARRKAEEKALRISFRLGMMESFSLDSPVDLVTCLYDSLNYLLFEEALRETFAHVRQNLNPKGAFIFDMNTEYGLSTFWGSTVRLKDNRGMQSVWVNHFDGRRKIATLEITLFVPQGSLYTRLQETHQERAYTQKEIRNTLKRAGFGRVHFYRHLMFTPPDRHTGRIMVVAQPR